MASRPLVTVGVLLAVALSGCAAFPYVGPTCGPGETDIGTISDNATGVHVKGEVAHVNRSVLVIDDGTGQAGILLFDEGVSGQVAEGDCVIADNAVAAPADDRSEDVIVLTGDLYKEEVVVEDERG